MNRMTAMTEQTLFIMKSKRLRDLMQTTVEQFQKGEDAAGLESLISAAEELENAVENDQKLQRPQIDLSRLLPAVRRLYFYIQNQDITSIVDLLEDTFCPLTEEWLEGRASS